MEEFIKVTKSEQFISIIDFLIQNVAFIVLCPVNAHDASSPEANKKQIISLKMYFIKHKISQTFFLYSLFIYF